LAQRRTRLLAAPTRNDGILFQSRSAAGLAFLGAKLLVQRDDQAAAVAHQSACRDLLAIHKPPGAHAAPQASNTCSQKGTKPLLAELCWVKLNARPALQLGNRRHRENTDAKKEHDA
jgi:hypothetical protein